MTHPVQATSDRPPTLGEYRVGITFNPSNSGAVQRIKQAAADFIDACAEERVRLVTQDDPEVLRLWALATTHIEDAAMWAVKAVTKPVR